MRTTQAISITLPKRMLQSVRTRARKENRTMSELVREALRRYEASQWLAELQAYGKERAAVAGLTEDDVDRVIHEARLERRKDAAVSRPVRRRAS